MLAPSHMVGGQFAYLFAAWWLGHVPAFAEALMAAGAALLPDLDHRSGSVGRRVPWISGAIEYWAGHRTVTHSVLALSVVVALAWALLPQGFSLALIAGFFSHAVLDMMTPNGVAWFWPARSRCVIPGDQNWRMSPMGKGELSFIILLACLTLPVLLAAGRGVGLLGTVRDVVGDIESARQHYNAHKSEAEWWLRVEGQDNQEFKPVEGRFCIIGPYQSGLIVETPDGPRSVCKDDDCDWYARRTVLERGDPIQTTTRQLHTEKTTVRELLDALEPLSDAGRVYLLGSIRAEGLQDAEPTVKASAEGARLRYATLGQLGRLGGEIEAANLLVQVRHEPGADVPRVGAVRQEAGGQEKRQDRIDPLLEAYLPE